MKFLALLRFHENMNDKIAADKFYEEMGGEEGMFSLPEGVKILESARALRMLNHSHISSDRTEE